MGQIDANGLTSADGSAFLRRLPAPAADGRRFVHGLGQAANSRAPPGVGVAAARCQRPCHPRDGAATEADKAITAPVKPASGLRDKWDAAEAKRDSAEAAIVQHRTTVKEPLIAAVNAERRNLLASLVQIATKEKLGKKWPESFFRPARKGKKAPLEVPES
ncbi:MAG: hypothetical protein FJ100_23615 [Deltaproteobacteria bacterium]|nr:hypothetical protein [Deltaproteobacteria bacterium]